MNERLYVLTAHVIMIMTTALYNFITERESDFEELRYNEILLKKCRTLDRPAFLKFSFIF